MAPPVLNKQIAADMLPHHDILLRPLVTVLAETPIIVLLGT
ncbi:hypothetical protein ACT7C1_30075 [Bacillus paranthracis]